MPELGKLTAVFDADTRRFDAGVRGVAAKTVALESTLRGLSAGGTQAIGTMAGLASPLALAAGGAVIAASAISGVAVGLFELTKSAAKVGGELFDLSQKTSFAVETLSGLSIIAKTTGSDIQSISASLIIFQKNMGAAQDATSKQGQLFKELNIDTLDNEKALRQAFTALAKYGETQKGVEIATKLFGRSGAAVLAMVKETNGNLDEAIKKYRQMGLTISTQAARESDKFNDVLEETTLQFEAVTRKIGLEFLPVVMGAMRDISKSLADNQTDWGEWGKQVITVLNGARIALSGFLAVMAAVTRMDLSSALGVGIATMVSKSREIHALEARDAARPPSLRGVNPFTDLGRPKEITPLGTTITSSGGGGGGGKSEQKDILENLREALMDLNTEYRKYSVELLGSANAAEVAAEKERLLQSIMSSMKTPVKERIAQIKDVDQAMRAAIGELPAKAREAAQALVTQALAQIKVNQATRIAGDLNKQTEALTQGWRLEMDRAESGADSYALAIEDLAREYAKYDQTLSATTKLELEQIAAMKRTRDAAKQLQETIGAGVGKQMQEKFLDMFRSKSGEEVFLKDTALEDPFKGAFGKGNYELDRAARMEEEMEKLRHEMRRLGFELTDIFAFSIEDGFNRGVKSGLATLSIGLLRIVEDVFLRRMAEGLSKMLEGMATGGGGGGFWSGLGKALLGAVFGSVGGTFGGGAGKAGGGGGTLGKAGNYASGGYLPPGEWGLVGEQGPEFAYGGKTGMTIRPTGEQTTVINNYYIQMAPVPKGSYQSPKSARQQGELVMAYIKGNQS